MQELKVHGQKSVAAYNSLFNALLINPNSNSLKQSLVDFESLLAFIPVYHDTALRLRPLSSHYHTNCMVTGLLICKAQAKASFEARTLV